MVRTVNGHHDTGEIDDQGFASTSPEEKAVKGQGRKKDPALRSKHSETEQRRRSKINERFQVLRDLIPENDQKRDKASFLLEVIHYIQFLQEKLQAYEGTFQGWSPEPSKLNPWVAGNGAGDDDGMAQPPMFSNSHKSMEFELNGTPLYTSTDNSPGSGNLESSFNLSVQRDVFDFVSVPPPQGSFPDPEPSASQSPSDYWPVKTHFPECAFQSYNGSLQEQRKPESGVNGTSNVNSQRLLNTLSNALGSAGVDLSQTNISVQLDVCKRSDGGPLTTEDSSSFQQTAGYSCSMPNYDHSSKRRRTNGTV